MSQPALSEEENADKSVESESAEEGEHANKKRVGRGMGSGMGKTSARGHKGQRSRSGSQYDAWF